MKQRIRTGSIILIGVLLLLVIALYVSMKAGYILCISEYLPYPNNVYVLIALTGVITCTVLFPLLNKARSSYFLVIVLCLVLTAFVYFDFQLASKPEIEHMTSPDGKHQMMLIEYDHVVGYIGKIYEKTNAIYMKEIYEYSVDKSCPFVGVDKTCEWNNNGFVLKTKNWMKYEIHVQYP